ncbi:MAG: ADP-forming succinate--CoA ligase subunit beta [Dehalococcoidia bacterium]|jgi:succinyl-CoA synthetase beta subunit|nr:ADP-forming succinate--CoA ligase subunit beta [Dehalococcoidia bacterium]
MKIHEYQAKALLNQYGIPVPKGGVASSVEDVAARLSETGLPAVLKAQIHAGGRGKAGGILPAGTREEGLGQARRLLGSRLATRQTGTDGLPVNSILVEEAMAPERELYLALLIDRSARLPAIIASDAGGMDIEEVATNEPERVARLHIDPLVGVLPYQGRNLARSLNLPAAFVPQVTDVARNAWRLFVEKDCSLVEMNPLVVTKDARLVALDAKVTFDDNALFRHPELAGMRDVSQEDSFDAKAADIGVNYIRLDGDIGCLVNGAGLAMATMDLVTWAGGQPANFLDVGGGPSEDRLVAALEMMLSDPKVRAAWVNVFGGILRCDVLATAIVRVVKGRDVRVPFIVRMNGTNLEQAMATLRQSGLPIIFEPDLAQAARRAVAAARGAGGSR